MVGSKISLIETRSQQIIDCLVYEFKKNHYFVECYPYATQEFVLSTIFWVRVIGVLILVF